MATKKTKPKSTKKTTTAKPAQPKIKRLYRSGEDRMIAGICGGVGEYLKMDSTLIRLLWAASFFIGGIGFFAYIIGWFIIPKNPKHKWES
ncbi:PspC domain-containing protein [Candidatus Undinarchaeota archaeon]